MTDLTEQWKKGELEQKYYYVQYKSLGKSWTEIELKGFLDDLVNCRDVDGRVSILAPVPSYDELIEERECNDFLVRSRESEIQKLKNLLKECRKWIGIERDFGMPNEKVILQQFLAKIDEVLK